MATRMAMAPGGNLSEVFEVEAAREAAYRFVRNPSIDSKELSRAAARATAARCFGHGMVYVPVDGSSLNLPDPNGTRGMGRIGTAGKGAQGLQLMTAIAADSDGVPIGICGQRYWSRRKPVGLKANAYDARPHCKRESRYWLDVIDGVAENFRKHAPSTKPFFQLDRGGDDWRVLAYAVDNDVLLTTRAAHNRRIGDTYLWPAMAATEPQCSYVIEVAGGPVRQARCATVQVQFRALTINVRDRQSGQVEALTL